MNGCAECKALAKEVKSLKNKAGQLKKALLLVWPRDRLYLHDFRGTAIQCRYCDACAPIEKAREKENESPNHHPWCPYATVLNEESD